MCKLFDPEVDIFNRKQKSLYLKIQKVAVCEEFMSTWFTTKNKEKAFIKFQHFWPVFYFIFFWQLKKKQNNSNWKKYY